MKVPSILQADSLKRLLQGVAAGAVVTMIVGFNWGGWTFASTVEVAKEQADAAVIAAVVPICVDQFRQAVDATANLSELNKFNYAWDRDSFVFRR